MEPLFTEKQREACIDALADWFIRHTERMKQEHPERFKKTKSQKAVQAKQGARS